MQQSGVPRMHPELKEIVVQASQALARLDAKRLEELALSCRALNRTLAPGNELERAALRREAGEAAHEMAVFGRVLEATRANLKVMNRLREMRLQRLEYEPQAEARWASGECGHGDN